MAVATVKLRHWRTVGTVTGPKPSQVAAKLRKPHCGYVAEGALRQVYVLTCCIVDACGRLRYPEALYGRHLVANYILYQRLFHYPPDTHRYGGS